MKTKKVMQYLATDGVNIVFITLFAIACGLFPVDNAPQSLNRVQKLFFYAISCLFRSDDNPKYYWYSQLVFVEFALGNAFQAFVFFKKQPMLLFWLSMLKGLSGALMALVNGMVNELIHVGSAFCLLIFLSISLFVNLYQKQWNPVVKSFHFYLLTMFVTASGTHQIYCNYQQGFLIKAGVDYDALLEKAPLMSTNFNEWAAIVPLFGFEWLYVSRVFDELMMKIKIKPQKQESIDVENKLKSQEEGLIKHLI